MIHKATWMILQGIKLSKKNIPKCYTLYHAIYITFLEGQILEVENRLVADMNLGTEEKGDGCGDKSTTAGIFVEIEMFCVLSI